MLLDPSSIAIESHTAHSWEQEEDFAQVMALQLKRAPWVAMSVLAHVIAGFILYFALDHPMVLEKTVAMAVEATEPEQVIEPEVPIKEPVEVPEQIEDPDHSETDPTDFKDTNVETLEPEQESTAFNNDQWNAAIGLDGGAGPRFGNGTGRGGRRKGAPKKIQDTLRAGLDWLARHQDENGRWDCDAFMKHDKDGAPCDDAGNPVHDVGVTGLALLAFLGEGSTLRSGEYKPQIKKAVKWLRSQQAENGLFGTAASHDFLYDHAIATYAICEAQGLSKYKALRSTAQQAINYLESHRNPYACWRYQPRDNDNDVSVTGWCIMAYKSAKDFGLQVNETALKTCVNYLDEVTEATTGRCGYTKKGEASSRHPGDHGTRFPVDRGEAMTAVGLFCRFFLGQDPKKEPVMRLAAETLNAKPPVWKADGSIDHYYWYYGSYALYQMGDPYWKSWANKLTPAVVRTQRKDGNFKGSWDADGVWGEDGGRVYSTAILVLTLEASYRYTKLVR